MGEFDLIARYFARPARPGTGLALGVGDDCALLAPASGMQLAVSTDMLVEGRHFLSTVDPARLGHKALAVNLSDLAAAGAKLTTAHGRLNLPAEYGLSWLLPRLIGLTRANDLLLSSRIVRAEEAEQLGLVNAVLPPDELLPYVQGYARDLATTVSRRSLAETKRQVAADLLGGPGTSIERSKALLDEMMGEPDFAEGVAALNEKRPPSFP